MGIHDVVTVSREDALFSPVQQRLLALLYGQPERRFQSGELIRLAASGTGAAHRQLRQFAAGDLITTTKVGNQKYYQANPAAPIFEELQAIVRKTFGLAAPLHAALEPLRRQIHSAFIFGSVARGTERARSDIDLMVIADSLEYPAVYEAIQDAERALARPVNPTVMTLADWRRKGADHDSFVSRIRATPRIFLIGNDDDLA